VPPKKRQPGVAGPRREKPIGSSARFAQARKNENDLLADCERLLLHEATKPQMQNGGERRLDVIHPSEMAKSNWCPRSTWLRITLAMEDRLPPVDPHHFQLENIFEEGHEYHRKWQARFRRMGRLQGRWYCNACWHRWFDVSPIECPKCHVGASAIDYHEVPLRDDEHLIVGNADGEVLAADWMHSVITTEDRLIEVKSIGEGTIRMELPRLLQKHTHDVPGDWGKTTKVLDTRGVWKEINSPFGPHLRQGLIYLRMRALMTKKYGLSPVERLTFIYEFKPTSMVKAFEIVRDDEAVDDLWEMCKDIKYALEGGRPPKCIKRDGPCDQCKPYEELVTGNKESGNGHNTGATQAGRATEEEPRGRRRAREAEPAVAEQAEDRHPRPRRAGSDRSGGQRADGPTRAADQVGGLLGRAARRR
jgi:hypothetical protein